MSKNIEIKVEKSSETYKAAESLLERTNKEKPSPKDIKALREHLDTNPELYQFVGNLAQRITTKIITAHTPGSFLSRECLERYVNELRQNFGYDVATPLEKLLIEQIALCWLRLQFIESEHYSNTVESHTLTRGIYWDRRLNNAQRRFTRAIESLMRVRKMQAQTELSEEMKSAITLSSAKNTTNIVKAMRQ